MSDRTGPDPGGDDARPKPGHAAPAAATPPNYSRQNNRPRRQCDPARPFGSCALGLAAADLPVFPLLPRSKQPRVAGPFVRGFHDATCDAERIDRHWYAYPHDNIAIRPTLGVAVLDIDPRNGGRTTLARLLAEYGSLPETWSARTGSGGQHLWFTVGQLPVGTFLGSRKGEYAGIDVKHGDTGFVVAPRSIHPNGCRYEWLIPPTGEPAMAYLWLRDLIRKPLWTPPEPVRRDVNGHGRYSALCLARRIETAPEGTRHDTARGAFLDAARQGDLDAFEPVLIAAALSAQRTATEIDQIIRYAREKTGR